MTHARAARPDAIRRHNLGVLLGQIHRDGALTRAQLTQRLSLSRSTIGALVADLTELGLVDEQVPIGGERAGRPSHVVGPREDGPYAIAVDVDITHLTVAAVGIGGDVLARQIVTTAPSSSPAPPVVVARHIVAALPKLRDEVSPSAWPVGIGVSIPGAVNRDGTVEFAPNLLWRHEAFGAMLNELAPQGLQVYVGNDADLAVLAEHLRGNARGCDDVVYLIGRIGVGAGIVANGVPLRGRDGHAGEVGHTVYDASGPPCHCGKRGCVETYVGENALLELAGRHQTPTPERVAAVFADATSGDRRAADAVRTVATSLGRSVANLVNILNPERVVLGGSLANVLEFAHDEVEQALRQYAMATAGTAVQLRTAALGDDSSLIGAAELALQELLSDPLLPRAALPGA